LTTYKANPNNANYAVPDKVYLMEAASPPLKTAFTVAAINGTNSGVTMDTRYRERMSFDGYDAYSNVTQVSKKNDVPISYQYGHSNALPVAQIRNASNTVGLLEFKYEGFENGGISGVITDPVASQSGNCYKNGDYTISFTKPNTRNYIIEYYYSSSSKWNYIQKTYTGPTMALTEGSRIDNVRIRPADSEMTSYTYNPVIGITSLSDPSHVTTYYAYDAFGRLSAIKDSDSKTVKSYEYHYKGN
jgi:YD repeat-containing protein